GFDPEPGVYCLAPALPADGVIVRAAQRIARVYGLPLLRTAAWSCPLWNPPSRSARHRHAALLEDEPALGLGQPAPHAERLACLQRELAALFDHRAPTADLFGLRR